MSQIVQDPERVTAAARGISTLARMLLNQDHQLRVLTRAALVEIEQHARDIEKEMVE